MVFEKSVMVSGVEIGMLELFVFLLVLCQSFGSQNLLENSLGGESDDKVLAFIRPRPLPSEVSKLIFPRSSRETTSSFVPELRP